MIIRDRRRGSLSYEVFDIIAKQRRDRVQLYHISWWYGYWSTDVIQLTLTLKMTTAQVVETSVTVNNNGPIQDYVHPDDQTHPTFE